MKSRVVAVLFAVVVSGVLSMGASCSPMVSPAPSQSSVESVRQKADAAVSKIETGLTIINRTGTSINALPLPADWKDRYDCAVIKAVGVEPVTPKITAACGTVPTHASAPVQKSLETLKTVASCASLQSTLTALRPVISPIIDQLDQSNDGAVRMAGIAVRAGFEIVMLGDASCN